MGWQKNGQFGNLIQKLNTATFLDGNAWPQNIEVGRNSSHELSESWVFIDYLSSKPLMIHYFN